MSFVTGASDIHEVRLPDHATVISGSETAATVCIDISGDENMDGGIDWLAPLFSRYPIHGDQHGLPGRNTIDRRGDDGRFQPAGADHGGLFHWPLHRATLI